MTRLLLAAAAAAVASTVAFALPAHADVGDIVLGATSLTVRNLTDEAIRVTVDGTSTTVGPGKTYPPEPNISGGPSLDDVENKGPAEDWVLAPAPFFSRGPFLPAQFGSSSRRRDKRYGAGAQVMVKTVGMEFLCYHRDRPGSATLRGKLREEHWSYMDRYQAEMIARGPTLADDGDTPTGSVHIVSLPDPAAARAFAFDEPNYQAGVYRDVLLRRWRNLLGRTMWDFPGGRDGGNRYLVLGLGTGPGADLAVPPDRDELIAYGPLLSDDGAAWLGTAVLVRAPDPDQARAILTRDRYADVEVHNWHFGGRPS